MTCAWVPVSVEQPKSSPASFSLLPFKFGMSKGGRGRLCGTLDSSCLCSYTPAREYAVWATCSVAPSALITAYRVFFFLIDYLSSEIARTFIGEHHHRFTTRCVEDVVVVCNTSIQSRQLSFFISFGISGVGMMAQGPAAPLANHNSESCCIISLKNNSLNMVPESCVCYRF